MKTLKNIFAISLIIGWVTSAAAEDTDLFLTPASTAVNPNVLIVIDNTANWNTSFEAEMAALASVVGGLTDKVNVGIMMFTETGGGNGSPDGAYVRSGIKQMNSANKAALINLINGLSKIGDKSNSAKFSLASLEAYQYLTGKASYSGYNKVKRDTAVFAGDGRTYISPYSDACQKSYVIFLSNGPASDNTADGTSSSDNLTSYAGVTQTEITLSPNGEQSNWSDEWARFMSRYDMSTYAGNQYIYTHTIDVESNVTGQSDDHSELLRTMADKGKGTYAYISNANATDTSKIAAALNAVFSGIQAVDSVFAASSLPISVNVQGAYVNQVYMGVFRPDANSSARWMGNLKQYKLATGTAGLFLSDINGTRIDNSLTGFVIPTVTSYWTASSSFWGFEYTAASDSPDGDIVEKGGAAQKLRTAYATDQSGRSVFTCTGTCANGSTLSSYPFATSNASIDTTSLGVSTTTERNNIINWLRGTDNIDDEDGTSTTTIRPSVHGDVVHSRPAVINYNRSTNDIYVFYGDNGGLFHAVKGGDTSSDGDEAWSFIPSELFGKIKRLRDATYDPATNNISTSNPKSYFMDGPVSVYQNDANGDKKYDTTIDPADKVHLFIGMRRGGRTLYALDVSDPTAPKYLWKNSNSSTSMSELGYTWSEAKVGKLNIGGTMTNVLIFGGGYDPTVEDLDPDRTYTTVTSSTASGTTTTTTTNTRKQLTTDSSASGSVISTSTVTVTTAVTTGSTTTTTTTAPSDSTTTYTRSMGRAIYIVNALTGDFIWSAGRTGSGASKEVSGMDYAIPAAPATLDTDGDGDIDTVYVGDTGGNLWRVNLSDTDTTNWSVAKLAAVGGSAANKRKLLYKPSAVVESGTRYILVGSGDREHPFDTVVTNRFYMFRDTGALTGLDESDLYDATSNAVQSSISTTAAAAVSAINAANGWYITLASGEKLTGSGITINGTSYFGTNQPSSVLAEGVCSNLGLATYYGVDYLTGGATLDTNGDGVFSASDRALDTGVGNPTDFFHGEKDGVQGAGSGTKILKGASVKTGQRYRVYWHLELDK